jgi:hypothetical protein
MAALATVLVATEFQPRLHEGASAGAYPTSFLPARSAGRFVAAASDVCVMVAVGEMVAEVGTPLAE